jgi:acetylornithine deacetylase
MGGTPAEATAQWFLADLLTDIGLEVHTWHMDLADLISRPDFPGMEVTRTEGVGVVGIWRGSSPGNGIMLNGHSDVVPPGDPNAWNQDPFEPVHVSRDGEDIVIARGACDMKGGLIAAIDAVRSLREAGFVPRQDIVIAPVIGEEDGGLGTYSLIKEGLPMFYNGAIGGCIIPEPTSLAVIPANAGALTFRLRVPGAAIHASRRSEGVSAIEKFYPILHALQQLEIERNLVSDPLMQRWPIAYPMSIGTLQSGDWASTVPDLLIAEGRYGVALGEDIGQARDQLEECVAQACKSDPWLRDHPAEIEWWGGQFASGSTALDTQIMQSLTEAHGQIHKTNPEVYAAPYGSDLRLLSGIGCIPTVQYGPGDAGVAHAPNEYVTLNELRQTQQALTQVLVNW